MKWLSCWKNISSLVKIATVLKDHMIANVLLGMIEYDSCTGNGATRKGSDNDLEN